MPYIPAIDRNEVLYDRGPVTAGELNYQFTETILGYLNYKGGVSYGNLNEVIGVLECCKLELYRRLAVPYEEKKIIENGDVYV